MLDLLLAAGGRWNYSTDLGEEIWDALDIAPHSRAQIEDVLARHGVRRPTNE